MVSCLAATSVHTRYRDQSAAAQPGSCQAPKTIFSHHCLFILPFIFWAIFVFKNKVGQAWFFSVIIFTWTVLCCGGVSELLCDQKQMGCCSCLYRFIAKQAADLILSYCFNQTKSWPPPWSSEMNAHMNKRCSIMFTLCVLHFDNGHYD